MGLYGFDAFSPAEILAKVETVGVAKARLPLAPMLMLAVLAGAFVGLGALYYVVVRSDPSLGFATRQVLGGAVFSLGLLLVVVAGADLFTGNNLLVMARAAGKISTAELLRSWALVLVGNAIGAGGLAVLVFLSGHPAMNDGAVAAQYLQIASAKTTLPFASAFFSGVLCNALVCVALWMAFAGRSVVDKAVALIFPVSAFVAAGFEHSIANIYLLLLAMLIQAFDGGAAAGPSLSWFGIMSNMVPVMLGNLVGGSVFVGLVFHIIYRRTRPGE
ncbi:formate/nitrite transporter family protein [Massilia soli]|uniref:Formate/nitrite transporter family protein n=1 Tax=Massilia soli TaxID=2792854 RepID=A0ABS7SUL1_9BURK|nr:formate/nitrite transporter family protein [Massilia soli]MBZ2209609.1 formate/nitrite transporter family protein [Massilia soli]